MDTHASSIVPIPLHQLHASPLNARTIDAKPLDELAASILAEGLLQNLTVVQIDDARYEVVAGERRRRALTLLQERGQLPPELESPPCLVVENGRAMSASLAENSVRERMHPADEYAAYARLVKEGRSIDEIAHEFGVKPIAVQRHLKLANVAPELFELYRQDKIRLDQMHALALTDDHDAQRNAWNVADYQRTAGAIRDRLTKAEINIATDDAARFVGLAAIEAAGGIVRRDLFGGDNAGYTTERQLIDQLALEKLEVRAELVRAEGWSWVEAHVDGDDAVNACKRIDPERHARVLSQEDEHRLDAIEEELQQLRDKYDDTDEWPDAESSLFAQLEFEAEEIRTRRHVWHQAQLDSAGAIVTIGYDGELAIRRGLVRKGDKAPKVDHGKTDASAGSSVSNGSKAPDSKKTDLSSPMIARLTAHRTAMLQGAVARRPDVALAILAHALMLPVFYRGHAAPDICTIDFAGAVELDKEASELTLARHWNATHDHIQKIREGLPGAADLFGWLLEQDGGRVLELLTVCTAVSLDAIVRYGEEPGYTRSAVTAIVHATGLDFAEHWSPTRENFLSHVTRAVIEETVREVHGEPAVVSLAEHKKDALVNAAEQLLGNSGWLPKIFRVPPPKVAPTVANAKPEPKPAPAKKAKGKAK